MFVLFVPHFVFKFRLLVLELFLKIDPLILLLSESIMQRPSALYSKVALRISVALEWLKISLRFRNNEARYFPAVSRCLHTVMFPQSPAEGLPLAEVKTTGWPSVPWAYKAL